MNRADLPYWHHGHDYIIFGRRDPEGAWDALLAADTPYAAERWIADYRTMVSDNMIARADAFKLFEIYDNRSALIQLAETAVDE